MNKKMLAAVLVSVTPWFFGCGGGGGDGQTAAPAAAAVAPAKTVRIEAYGDSTMWGADGGNIPNQASITQPSSAQAALQAGYGSTVTVSNEGVPLSTASTIINGSDGKHLPWTQQMANSTAQIVAVNFAINDAWTVNNESPEQYRALLTEIVTVAKGAGKVVVLVEPNAINDPVNRPNMAAYVTVMRDVAAATGAPLVPNYAYPAVTPDNIHPNAATYDAMGKRMAAVMWATVGNLIH